MTDVAALRTKAQAAMLATAEAAVSDYQRLELYEAYAKRAWGEYCTWNRAADTLRRNLEDRFHEMTRGDL